MAIVSFLIMIVAMLISLFAPTLYSRDWSFTAITGLGNVYEREDETLYDLFSLYGVMYIIFSLITIAAIVLLIVFYKKKMLNFYVTIPFALSWCFPTLFLFLGRRLLENESNISGIGVIYGSGTSSGLTSAGHSVIFLTFLAIILLVFYEYVDAIKTKDYKNSSKSIKQVELKKEKDIKIDNFKM